MRLSSYSRLVSRVALVSGLPLASVRAQEIDTARALSALRDATTSCEADGGRLWKRSLCGPIALVDRKPQLQQRFLTASQLGWRIGRPQFARRRQKLRAAADHRRHWDRIGTR